MTNLRIATRGSRLALWQAEHVRDRLAASGAGVAELVILKTTGDRIQDRPLSEVGGKGLFTKEIEEALLDGRADLAVHSMKDLPSAIPERLMLACVPEREDVRDALLVREGLAATSIAELPEGARVGTSSLRRACQLRFARRDLAIESLRGNVDTRVKRLDEGAWDAIVLASAGLRRLGLGDRITRALDVSECLPAIGQGALAIETREDDERTRAALAPLTHRPTSIATAAERAFLARLEGGCKTPLAAHAILEGETLRMSGLVGRVDGSELLRAAKDGVARDEREAAAIGVALAELLLERGAAAILSDVIAAG